jgi:hypothetical protein
MVVSLHLLIPQYGHLTSLTCFCWFWYVFIPVFFVQLYPCFLAYVKSVVVRSLCRVLLCIFLLPIHKKTW